MYEVSHDNLINVVDDGRHEESLDNKMIKDENILMHRDLASNESREGTSHDAYANASAIDENISVLANVENYKKEDVFAVSENVSILANAEESKNSIEKEESEDSFDKSSSHESKSILDVYSETLDFKLSQDTQS